MAGQKKAEQPRGGGGEADGAIGNFSRTRNDIGASGQLGGKIIEGRGELQLEAGEQLDGYPGAADRAFEEMSAVAAVLG